MIEKMKNILFKNTIKHHMSVFVMVFLLCLLVGYVHIFYLTYSISSDFSKMFNMSLELQALDASMDRFETSLEQYLNTKDSDSFVAYLDEYNYLTDFIGTYGASPSYQNEALTLYNISMLLEDNLQLSQQAINYKRARNIIGYVDSYSKIEHQSIYIDDYIEQLNQYEFTSNLENYMLLSNNISNLKYIILLMCVALIMLSLIYIYYFTGKVTRPISLITEYAGEISGGNYDVEITNENFYDEANILADSFSDMRTNIKRYISEVEDKAETENKLKLTEIENLKMQNMLKTAQITALQSQINPHFLFNTLNAGVQLSILENADRTSEFLESLASIFRYNIQNLENTVALKDELFNVKKYCDLMKVRFADAIEFIFHINAETLNLEMPPLILQPLLENALVHGISDKEEAGQIDIYVEEDDETVTVIIEDNGRGIEEEHLRRLIESNFDLHGDSKYSGHTTGLGIGNVYERLRNFYGRNDCLHIESELNKGTRVIIKIAKEVAHV